MAHKVFICHSSIDKLVADAACAALEAQRIPCWIAPRDVLPGMEYGKAIIQALSDCEIVLLIFSSHANHSGQVRREIERAVSKEKIILPFRIENVLPSDAMEFALGNTHWLDALTPPLESYLVKLCDTVMRLLQQQNKTPLWRKQTPDSEDIRPMPVPQEAVAEPEPVSAPIAANAVSVPERIAEPPHAVPQRAPADVAAEAAPIPTPIGESRGRISGPISEKPAGEPLAEENGMAVHAESESDRDVVTSGEITFEKKTASWKQTWVRVLVPLAVILLAVGFTIWSRISSTRKSEAENQQSNAMTSPSNLPAVDLARIETASAMADADKNDAVVVTIAQDGSVFLGQDHVAASELGQKVLVKLADRVDSTVYVRADQRALYRYVEDNLDAMRRAAGVDAVGFLTLKKGDTGQANSLKSIGLEVVLPSRSQEHPRATRVPGLPPPPRTPMPTDRDIVIRVIYRPDAPPAYKINLTDVAQAELLSKVVDIYANRAERVMFVKGDDNIDFGSIADVIDIGRAAGVDKIALVTQGAIAGN
jgi:biopolymer transport protein ExbD